MGDESNLSLSIPESTLTELVKSYFGLQQEIVKANTAISNRVIDAVEKAIPAAAQVAMQIRESVERSERRTAEMQEHQEELDRDEAAKDRALRQMEAETERIRTISNSLPTEVAVPIISQILGVAPPAKEAKKKARTGTDN